MRKVIQTDIIFLFEELFAAYSDCCSEVENWLENAF